VGFSLLDHNSGFGTNSATTNALNTTGANLIVLGLSCASSVTPAISDSQSNTWTQIALVSAGTGKCILYYCSAPSTSASHTFTASATNIFAFLAAQAWSGAKSSGPLDQQTSNGSGSSATIQPGSITPSQNNCLVITAMNGSIAGTMSIDSSFSISDQKALVGSVNYTGAMADFVQGTAAAINPTWTNSGGASFIDAAIASFLPSTGTNVNLVAAAITAADAAFTPQVSVPLAAGAITAAAANFTISLPVQNIPLTAAAITALAEPFSVHLTQNIPLTRAAITAAAGSFGLSPSVVLSPATITAKAAAFFAESTILSVPLITIMNNKPIPVSGAMTNAPVPMTAAMTSQVPLAVILNNKGIPVSGAMNNNPVAMEGAFP